MTAKSPKLYALAGLLTSVAMFSAVAAPIVGTNESFTAGAQGWVVQNVGGPGSGGVTAPQQPSGGNPGAYLRMVFGAQTPGAGQNAQFVANSGSSGGAYVGNYVLGYGDALYVTFDLLAENFLPSSMALYLHSAVSGNTWAYNLNAPGSLGVWRGYSVSFASGLAAPGGWQFAGGPGGTPAQFLSDLNNVDWIGIYISRFGSSLEEDYGLDNFLLHVPEPGTLYVLSAVLLSLCMTFRGYLSAVGSKIRELTSRA